MKKIVSFVVLLVGIIFLAGCGQPQNTQSQKTAPDTREQPVSQLEEKQTPIKQDSKNNSNSNDANAMELKIETTKQGTGSQVIKSGDTISVQYTGKLVDGTKFDSSYDHGGQPFTFQIGIGKVIKGWDQGLLGAKVGEKRTLTIPASLGYGATGAGGVIPPNATLIFDVEVVSIQ